MQSSKKKSNRLKLDLWYRSISVDILLHKISFICVTILSDKNGLSLPRVPLKSNAGVNHGRSKEKRGESGRSCTWKSVAIIIDSTHAVSIPGDQTLSLSATWVHWLHDQRDKKDALKTERTREKLSRRFPLNIFTRKTPAPSREIRRKGLYRGWICYFR